MTVQEVKQSLQSNQDIDSLIVFLVGGDNEAFVAEQYVDRLNEIRGTKRVLISTLDDLPLSYGISLIHEPSLYLYKVDKLSEELPVRSDLVVITRKVDSRILETLMQNVVKIPAIERWMVEDYIESTCPKLGRNDINWLIDYFESNLYRISLELQKLSIFPVDIQPSLFADCKQHGVFVNYRDDNTFKLSNALQLKDKTQLCEILSDKAAIDLEAMSFISVWQNNLKKLIKVWLNKSPTSENTGLKSNQIWAINKLPRTYSKEQLRAALELIDKMGYLIKSGNFPPELVIDYVVLKAMAGVV